VVVDFQRLFAAGGDPFDQPVRPGDFLNIPERQYDVAVLGAVGRPGLVPYAAGRTVDQYVRLAGWYSRRADWREASVIRGSTGSRVVAREARVLEPGDQIIVPFRERRTVLERIQTTQAVVAILSGALLTVASLRSIF
jgi:protein involved in polysaccharide export with SLBB domain